VGDGQQVSEMVPGTGSVAMQVKITVPGGCSIFSAMTVRTGLTPVQLLFGQPAICADTVDGAVNTAGLVVNIRFPFLIWLAGILVCDVAGPTRTLFCPGAVLPPAFWHW